MDEQNSDPPKTYFFAVPPYDGGGRELWLSPYVDEILSSSGISENVKRGVVYFSLNVYTALLYYYFMLRADLQSSAFRLFKEFVQSKEFMSARSLTVYDPYMARTTAISFAIELAKKVREDEELARAMEELGGGEAGAGRRPVFSS